MKLIMPTNLSPYLSVIIAFVVFLNCNIFRPANKVFSLKLLDNWQIIGSAEINSSGKQLSNSDYDTSKWISAKIPATVLGALTAAGEYNNWFIGENLKKIPTEQFKNAWWYRQKFSLPENRGGNTVILDFEGINYSADVWLNGQQIGAADTLKGAFRQFCFDVTSLIKPTENVLAVKVYPPQPGDFTIGFVDWNPLPPDRNMGLWRGVKLSFSQNVSIINPVVESKVDLVDFSKAQLKVKAFLINHNDTIITGKVIGQIGVIHFEQGYSLQAREKKEIVIDYHNHPGLEIQDPELWWPNNMGDQALYDLELKVFENGQISDKAAIRFGIRETGDYINENGHRGYTINGRKVLIKGAGWVDDLFLADSQEKVEAQMAYARHMNLNCVRLEGFWGSNNTLYDLADEYGLLLMPGWSCQWEWPEYLGKKVDEFGGVATEMEIDLVARSLRDQVLYLRHHPSIFTWVVGSDMLPRPVLEQRYLDYLAKIDVTRPMLSACAIRTSDITGPSAVKMDGPYDYVPPVYWYEDTLSGGAFGFNTETGPGPQPPPLASVKKMIPQNDRWPLGEVWKYHYGRKEFENLDVFKHALEKRYGESHDLDSFLFKSQAASYEALRAMFEAFNVYHPNATGVIQWMLNSAWPETHWQLFDWFLNPNGGFYGTKSGCQPLNLIFNYKTSEINLYNGGLKVKTDLIAEIRLYDFNSKLVYEDTLTVDAAENSSKVIQKLKFPQDESTLYFLDMKLGDKSGEELAHNFYWLTEKPDVLDYQKNLWFVTPIKEFADFTELDNLPHTTVNAEFKYHSADNKIVLDLTNETDKIAFFIELIIFDEDKGDVVLPVFWEDNYISLLPGESRTITCEFKKQQISFSPFIQIQGWNINKQTLK